MVILRERSGSWDVGSLAGVAGAMIGSVPLDGTRIEEAGESGDDVDDDVEVGDGRDIWRLFGEFGCKCTSEVVRKERCLIRRNASCAASRLSSSRSPETSQSSDFARGEQDRY